MGEVEGIEALTETIRGEEGRLDSLHLDWKELNINTNCSASF